MTKLLCVGIFLLSFCSCNGQDKRYSKQMEVVGRLLNYSLRCDSLSVQNMFAPPLKEIGQSKDNINEYVKILSQILRKSGIPDKNKYRFTEYTDKSPQLVDIEVPITDKYNRLLIVKFVKYYPAGKIFNFELVKAVQPRLDPIEAPKESKY